MAGWGGVSLAVCYLCFRGAAALTASSIQMTWSSHHIYKGEKGTPGGQSFKATVVLVQ